MRQRTIDALLEAYEKMQEIVVTLYEEGQLAFELNLENDASLLISQADLLFQVAENLNVVISEQEE